MNEPILAALMTTPSPTLIMKVVLASFCSQTWPLSSVRTSSPYGLALMSVTAPRNSFGVVSTSCRASARLRASSLLMPNLSGLGVATAAGVAATAGVGDVGAAPGVDTAGGVGVAGVGTEAVGAAGAVGTAAAGGAGLGAATAADCVNFATSRSKHTRRARLSFSAVQAATLGGRDCADATETASDASPRKERDFPVKDIQRFLI